MLRTLVTVMALGAGDAPLRDEVRTVWALARTAAPRVDAAASAPGPGDVSGAAQLGRAATRGPAAGGVAVADAHGEGVSSGAARVGATTAAAASGGARSGAMRAEAPTAVATSGDVRSEAARAGATTFVTASGDESSGATRVASTTAIVASGDASSGATRVGSTTAAATSGGVRSDAARAEATTVAAAWGDVRSDAARVEATTLVTGSGAASSGAARVGATTAAATSGGVRSDAARAEATTVAAASGDVRSDAARAEATTLVTASGAASTGAARVEAPTAVATSGDARGGDPATGVPSASLRTTAAPASPLVPVEPPAGGAAGGPLSLGEVLAAADTAFPSLIATRADVDAADGERLTAAGGFDPTWKTKATGVPVSGYPQVRVDSVIEAPTPLWGASFFAGYRWGAGTFQDYYASRETWTAGEVRAGASVPLIRNGPIDKRRAALAKAELSQRFAGLSLEQVRLEVARLAAVCYWDWVAAGRKREVARGLLQLAKDRDAQLSSRAQAGDVAVFDQQDNLRALVQREGLVVQAQRAVENTAFELSLYLRDANGEPVLPDDARMPAGLPAPEPALLDQADVDAALARRPDVQRLATKKQQSEIELRLQKNQLLPGLDVGVAVSKDLGASPRAEAAKLGPAELEVNALLDVPLLYRAPLGRIQSARADVSKVDAQLRLARDRVSVEVRDARSALYAALERARLARREVEVAEQLERGERTRFSLGDSTQLFVNLREQTTAEARLREVDALADFQKAAAALRLALAEPRLE